MTQDSSAAINAAMDPIYRAEFLDLARDRLKQERAGEHQAAEELALRVNEVQAYEALIAALENGRNLKPFGTRVIQATSVDRFRASREGVQPGLRQNRLAALRKLTAEINNHGGAMLLTAIDGEAP